MKRFCALLAKDLRLFFRRSGVVSLALSLVLLGALALGGGDLSRGACVEPFPIAVRDEDQTLMSASLIGQMKQVELFSEIIDGGNATDASLMDRGAAAVVTIPKDFFYDLYTMEPVTVELALNEDMPLESSLIRAVFTSVMDIIAANESVHLAVYEFCYGPLDQQEQTQLWEEFSNRLLRDALGRQLVFDTERMAADTADTVQSALRLCALSMLCLFFPMASVQAVPAERDTGLLARYRAAGGSMLPFLLAKLVTGLLLTLPTLAVASRYPAFVLTSRKKLIRALWRRAPLPLYTGKPAPVSLTPRSKSIISRFLASSQCGRAFCPRSGISLPIFTTTLSSEFFPSGTRSHGMFGSSTISELSSELFAWDFSSRVLDCSLRETTSFLTASASSFFPCFIRAPICEAILFCCARQASSSDCRALLLLSSSFILVTISRASKCLTASFLMTYSGSSRSSLRVNIIIRYLNCCPGLAGLFH